MEKNYFRYLIQNWFRSLFCVIARYQGLNLTEFVVSGLSEGAGFWFQVAKRIPVLSVPSAVRNQRWGILFQGAGKWLFPCIWHWWCHTWSAVPSVPGHRGAALGGQGLMSSAERAGVFTLEKRNFGGPSALHSPWQEGAARGRALLPGNRTRAHGFKLRQGRLGLDIRKNFFTNCD